VSSFLDSLLQRVSQPGSVPAYLVGVLLLLVLLALLAYVLVSVLRRIDSSLVTYLDILRARHAAAREGREKRLQELVDQFRESNSLRAVTASVYGLWRKTLSRIVSDLDTLTVALADVPASLDRVSTNLQRVAARLDSVVASQREAEPSREDSTAGFRVVRVAWAELIIATFLLVAVVPVNMGMLGLIIRDLGFIPASFQFAGVPLYSIFAALITVVEWSVGFLYSSFRHSERDNSGKIRLAPPLCALLALAFACVEGFFYSRIAPGKEQMFTFPFVNYEVPYSAMFFSWGFAFVWVLFGLGALWHRSLNAVLQNTPIHLQQAAARAEKVLRNAQRQAEATQAALHRVEQGTDKPEQPSNAERAVNVIETLREDLSNLEKDPPKWAHAHTYDLTRTDVQEQALRSGL